MVVIMCFGNCKIASQEGDCNSVEVLPSVLSGGGVCHCYTDHYIFYEAELFYEAGQGICAADVGLSCFFGT